MSDLHEPFKQAMSRFATGVCVVTYKKPSINDPEGVTMSAFSSLSLEPTKILFCLGNWSQGYKDFNHVSEFAVNILSAGQKDLAYQFAGRNRDNLTEHLTMIDGVPALNNTLATVICNKGNSHTEGDHDIVIGNVRHVSVSQNETLQPLLYYQSDIVESYQHVK